MRRRTFLEGSAAAAAAVAAGAARTASASVYLPDHAGKWEWKADRVMPSFAKGGEAAEFLKHLHEFGDLLKTAGKAWSNPVGYEVHISASVDGDALLEAPPHPIPGSLFAQCFWWYRSEPASGKPGEVLLDEESPFGVAFVFNSNLTLFSDRQYVVATDKEGQMFLEPSYTVSKHGWRGYPEGMLVTKRTGEPFEIMTKEHVLQAWKWMAEKEKRDDLNPYTTAEIHKREQDRIDALANRIAKLSAAERSAPAWVTRDSAYKNEFVDEHTKEAARTVRASSTFFDPKIPRTSLQSVVIKRPWTNHYSGHDVPGGDPVNNLSHALKFDTPKLVELLA